MIHLLITHLRKASLFWWSKAFTLLMQIGNLTLLMQIGNITKLA